MAGRMRLEYGPRRADAILVRRGDFFHIPPRLVHRDVSPDEEQELVVVNILIGRGEPVINVKGPRANAMGRSKESDGRGRQRGTRD